MVGVRTTETARRLAENYTAVSSAADGVFLYYKFGRYERLFPEKPYFLLSHCAHVLFTLWRFEEEEGGPLFAGWPRPTAFLNGLNFASLRYDDYKRRLIHMECLEEHWRNETQWFEFWIQVLGHWAPSGAGVHQEFSRCVLSCATQGDILETKEAQKNHWIFDRYMKTDAVGAVMLRTLSILDEVLRELVQCLAGLDAVASVLERIAVLTVLLSEIRRIVIYQTPAQGPYTPLGATRWRAPSPLGRLFWGRTQGILMVVPKREGGEILCTYDLPSQRRNRKRSWTRAASSLPGTYEQELFATWPYGTGTSRDDPGHPSDVRAHWTLQNEEAKHLETIARRMDALLEGLALNPLCANLVEEIRSASRNDRPKWTAGEVPWAYIERLDGLLAKLKSICREAAARRDGNASQTIVAHARPASGATTEGRDDSASEGTSPVYDLSASVWCARLPAEHALPHPGVSQESRVQKCPAGMLETADCPAPLCPCNDPAAQEKP